MEALDLANPEYFRLLVAKTLRLADQLRGKRGEKPLRELAKEYERKAQAAEAERDPDAMPRPSQPNAKRTRNGSRA